MKHPFNYLSLAALPALASLLYFPTGERDYLCFLGFLVFLRYLWVNPDELFLLSVREAATGAFLLQFALIWPCLFLFHFLAPQANPMPQALGISWAAGVIFFCLYHSWLEWREAGGLE